MRRYFAVAKCSMQTVLAYRSTYFISIFISIISMSLMFSLWYAVYEGRNIIAGMSWREMMAYLLIVFVLNTDVISEYRCARRVLNGSIVMDLIRPIRFQEYTLSESSSVVVFGIGINLLIGFFICLISGAFIPQSFIVWVAFLVSALCAMMIKLLVVFLSSLISFWTHNIVGMMWTRIAIVSFFSGSLVPFSYFPEWLKTVCSVLPFQAIVHTPAQIFLAQASNREMLGMIFLQLVWIVVFWLLAKAVFHTGVRRIVVNGG